MLRAASTLACLLVFLGVSCLSTSTPGGCSPWSGPVASLDTTEAPAQQKGSAAAQPQQPSSCTAPYLEQQHSAGSRSWHSYVLLRGLAVLLLCSSTAHVTRNAATAKAMTAASDSIALVLRLAVQVAICADLLSSSWPNSSSTHHPAMGAAAAGVPAGRRLDPQHASTSGAGAWQPQPQHIVAGTFLLNNVALFSPHLETELLAGALELLPLCTNLLLLQRSTAARSGDSSSGGGSTHSTCDPSTGQHSHLNASSSGCALQDSHAALAGWPLAAPVWLWPSSSSGHNNSRRRSSSLPRWLLLAGISRLLLPLLVSYLQHQGLRPGFGSRAQHSASHAVADMRPAAAAAAQLVA